MVALVANTPIEALQGMVMNWDTVPDKVKEYLELGTEFTIAYTGEDILVYTDRSIHATCSIVEKKDGQVRIVSCWVLNGKNIWK